MNIGTLEAFQLSKNQSSIESKLREKILLGSEILRAPPDRIMSPDLLGDRTRLDVMLLNGEVGLRGPPSVGGTPGFVRLPEIDSTHPLIGEMVETVRAARAPFPLASLRFRVDPTEGRGLWLDLPNEEIKALLSEPGDGFLARLMEADFFIEMGQKHKHVGRSPEGELKLLAPEAHAWLPSFTEQNVPVPLLSYVSLFSQPGPEANRALLVTAFELLDNAGVGRTSWSEWGAGYGNLSTAFASRLGTDGGWASELDEAAAELLARNLATFAPGVGTERLRADTVKHASEVWIADPPRPGFPELFRALAELALGQRPKWVMLFNCHNKGLISDASLLTAAGYKLKSWSAVDVFPATPYFEAISLWGRA